MARRGREARQAPAEPAPCASVAEHPALPGHTPGAARAPSVLTTPQPVPCGEHEEWAERGTSDTPTQGFQAPAETEAGSPIPVYSWETTRDVVHLRKHRNILNTNTLALAHSRGKPPEAGGSPSRGGILHQGGDRVGITGPRILTLPATQPRRPRQVTELATSPTPLPAAANRRSSKVCGTGVTTAKLILHER